MTAGRDAAADIAEQSEVLTSVTAANHSSLTVARERVASARVVRYVGIGSSRHSAGYGALALDLFTGIPSSVLPAPGAAVDLPAPRTDEPLVVVSQSGETPALLEVAQRARDADVAVVAVTNRPGSPLERIASVTLACGAGTERIVAATKSVTAQCLLLRALAKEPTRAEIDALVVAVRRATSLGVDAALGERLPGTVVDAGFAADWVADEIALKLMEMCGAPVASASVVEHFHGPQASDAPVLAFLDPNDPNSGELARRRNVTTVGPHPAFAVETPTTGEPSLDAIVTLVAGQRIAAAWSLHVGEDPDADRGLRKVTCTR